MTFPVVLLHGMCCTGDVWQNYRDFFEARGARVFTPTLRPEQRTRGGTPRSLAKVRLKHYVADMVEEVMRIRAEVGERPAIIGHSMGGLIAQKVAERNLVRAAVFLSPAAPVGCRHLHERRFWTAVRMTGSVTVPWRIRVSPAFANNRVLNACDDAQRERANATFVSESGRAFRDFASARIDERRVQIPTLTVAAGQDRLVLPSSSRRVGKKYGAIGGDFVEYEKHGHWIYDEPGWEKPAGDVYDWIERKAQDH